MDSNVTPARAGAGHLLEVLAVFALSISCIGLLAARFGVFDAPPVWIAGLLIAYAYHKATSKLPLSGDDFMPVWHAVLIVGVGLLFRLTPDAYILGGQDQGIYVNMAMDLARTGDLVPVDTVLAKISDPAVQDIYRQSNYTGTIFLPGIYAPRDGLVFQFYHLFPVWMALFGDGLDPGAAVYALTFLSLLSLLFFHRLAHLITGSATAGLVAGLLLAVNPLHAFFSRFPVTEVPTLAFSLISFSLLLSYWKRPGAEASLRFIVLSALAMGCLFMTRISGFMYVPFIAVLSVSTLIFDQNTRRRNGVLFWVALVLATYLSSVLYGLKWSAPYANDIYRLSFGMVFGSRWKVILFVLSSLSVFVWILFLVASKRPASLAISRKVLAWARSFLPVLGVAIAAIGFYKAYRLGYTDAYASDPWIERFKLANNGLQSLLSTSIIASAVYLSPFMFIAYFFAAFHVKRSPLLTVLLLFSTCFFAIVVLTQSVIFYQPYYARYLLSEFVPFAILLVVCVWAHLSGGKGWKYALLGGCLLLSALYCAALSSTQIGKSEHEGVAASMGKMVSGFDGGDLILIDASMKVPGARQLKTTLTFTMGLNAAIATASDLSNSGYLQRLSEPYDDVYLLTTDENEVPSFHEVDAIRFTEYAFKHGNNPPMSTWQRGQSKVRVLKRDLEREGRSGKMMFFGQGKPDNGMLGAGWSAPESWGIWSNSKVALVRFDVSSIDFNEAEDLRITITGKAYVVPRAPIQRFTALLEGRELSSMEVIYPNTDVEWIITVPAAIIPETTGVLQLQMPGAVSPLALNYSHDGRTLALGLERMSLKKVPEKPRNEQKLRQ